MAARGLANATTGTFVSTRPSDLIATGIPRAASWFWHELPGLSVPALPAPVDDLHESFIQAGMGLDHFTGILESTGLPPAIVGPLAVVLAAPGKFLIPLVILSPTASLLRLANGPRVRLSAHIDEVNRDLPKLLSRLEPLHIEAISGPEDAEKIAERLRLLYPYAESHWVEKSGQARRGERPYSERFAPTRLLQKLVDWPYAKILTWMEKKKSAMGEDQPWEMGFTPRALLKSFRRTLKTLKRRVVCDAVVVLRGIEPVNNYASAELTPEAIGKTALELGAIVETRLAALKNNLDDPRWCLSLAPSDYAALARELAAYGDLARFVHPPYSEYAAVETFIGLFMDVEMRFRTLAEPHILR